MLWPAPRPTIRSFRRRSLNWDSLAKIACRLARRCCPGVDYNNGFIYTEGNGTPSGRFIANNGPHEYISQGAVQQAVGLGQFADYRSRCRGASAGPSQGRDRSPRTDRYRGAGILRIAGRAGKNAEHAGGRRRSSALPRQQPQTGTGRGSRALRRDQSADPSQRSAACLAGCKT